MQAIAQKRDVQKRAMTGPTLRGPPWLVALAIMPCGSRPKKYLLAPYNKAEAARMTATRAKGNGLPPISLIPEKICTEVTRVNSNIKGTPSSVNAHMKTIVPPAKSPGIMRGSVMRRNLRKPVHPRFSAASSIAGSRFAERGDNVKVENWVEMQGVHHDDSPKATLAEPVDGILGVHEAHRLQQGIERAFLAEYLFNADGTDKRRQDHRYEDDPRENALPGKDVAIAEKGEGKGKKYRQNRARDGKQEGVNQAFKVDGISKNLYDVGRSQCPIGCEKGAA